MVWFLFGKYLSSSLDSISFAWFLVVWQEVDHFIGFMERRDTNILMTIERVFFRAHQYAPIALFHAADRFS